jgi:hypothetical protein
MQIVERGLIGLDDDVREVLPQLKELKVLVAFEDEDGEVVEPEPTSHDNGNGPYINRSLPKPKGQPIFEDVKGPITLRSVCFVFLFRDERSASFQILNPSVTGISSRILLDCVMTWQAHC